jgi:hypothetical protein
MIVTLVVAEKTEKLEGGSQVMLRPADPAKEFEGYWILKSGLVPQVETFRIGQRVSVLIEDEPTLDESEQPRLTLATEGEGAPC